MVTGGLLSAQTTASSGPIFSPTCRPDDPNSADFTHSQPIPTDLYENPEARVIVVQVGAMLGVLFVVVPRVSIPVTHPKESRS